MDRAAPVGRPLAFGANFPQVLAAAQADAPWAYRRLFEWLGGPVAGYVRGQGAEDAEGLANEVFLRAFRSVHGFTGDEARFRSWVFTIAHHCILDERRRRRRRPPAAGRPVPEGRSERSTEEEALARMGAQRVRRLLDQLSSDQHDVLLLRIVADLTVDQVAESLGRSPGAVKQLQRRGLTALRRLLTDEESMRTPLASATVDRGR